MNFELDDEQALVAQTIRRFVERELRTWAADADRAGAPPERLLGTGGSGGELGFFLDAVPADAGGVLDGTYSHTLRALRGLELGRGCAGLAALLETNVEPALAVGRWGTAAAQASLFGSLAGGGLATLAHDSRGTLDLTDAGDAADAADAGDAGGDVRLDGAVGPVPALATASHVVIATRTHLLLVPTSALTITPCTPSGWRAAQWATATLEAVRVPADFVLSRDPVAVETVLAWARISLAARAVGVATAAMEYAAAYAADRVQFGVPIGTFESLVRLRDDATTTTLAARLLVLHAATELDRAAPPSARALDLASRARVLAGDVVARATIDAVQIFGGYGFVNDYPVEKLMRDARAFEALHGDERLGRVLRAAGKER